MSNNPPPSRRQLPPSPFNVSDLPSWLDVPESNLKLDQRSVHTLFAVLMNDVDRSNMSGGMKRDVLEGLLQAWSHAIEADDDVEDVIVEYGRHGLETGIVEPDPRDKNPGGDG